jgi:hypothetical protein
LPEWLVFDASNNKFSGKPGILDRGSIIIKIIADDRYGGTAQATLTITVEMSSTLISQLGLILALVFVFLALLIIAIVLLCWYRRKKNRRRGPIAAGSTADDADDSDEDDDEEESFVDTDGKLVHHLKKTQGIKLIDNKLKETLTETGKKIAGSVPVNYFAPRRNVDALYSKNQTINLLSPNKAFASTLSSRNSKRPSKQGLSSLKQNPSKHGSHASPLVSVMEEKEDNH